MLDIKGTTHNEVNARVCGGDTALYLAEEGLRIAEEKGLDTQGYTQCRDLLKEAGGISFSGKQLALM